MTPDPSDIEDRLVELADLALRPGTYFNPQTEVVVVVDDSTSIDQEVFNMEDYEGADWVFISEEVPIDENKRDEVLEDFQTHYHPGSSTAASDIALDEVVEGQGEDEEKPRPGHAAAEADDDDEEEDEGKEPGRED